MKKSTLLFAAAVATMMLACNQVPKENKNTEGSEIQSEQLSENNLDESIVVFDINKISISDKDLGNFPFFTLPEGLIAESNSMKKNFDVCYFPVNGIMTPFEGKLYKANITSDSKEEFSKTYFEKSMEDYLLSVGAVKIFDGRITSEEYDRYNKMDSNKGAAGDIGYPDQQIKFYVIRSKEKGNIYVQFTANNASGYLNVLQEEALKQTMTKITADDIIKDLTEKGKSVVYINFDTDKTDIKESGKEVISQIKEALEKEGSLKIAIEGHTDNVGDEKHNKKLSAERANAVMNNLIAQGISKSRLSSNGFGAERPLVANTSEDNKAKNRRVELIKIN